MRDGASNKVKKLKLFRNVLLVILLFSSVSRAENSERFKRLGQEMICTCGCLQSLYDCRMLGCGFRPGMQAELQKIYDSEINIEISWRDAGPIAVKLGNEFYGFAAEASVGNMSEVLPWLQKAIHDHFSLSKYDVERLGGEFTPEMAWIP